MENVRKITPEERDVYEETLLIGESIETAAALIEALGLSREDVATKMSISVSELEELLDNGGLATLADLSKLALAIGFRWQILATEMEDGVELPIWTHRMLHGRSAPELVRAHTFG